MFRNHLRTVLFAACVLVVVPCAASAQFRRIDGGGNNPLDPSMGAADTRLARKIGAYYDDGVSAPAGPSRPGAREVSNAIASQSGPVPNALGASDFVWQWGQFLDHDIDLTGGAAPVEPFDIPVPSGDPWFDPNATGTQVIPLDRSFWTADGGGIRQQMNQITAWIDASNVYGSDVVRAKALRTMDGTGRLKTSSSAVGDLLPFNVSGLPNAPDASPGFFLAGDVRANEQIGLTSMHTLFVREHNFVADLLRLFFPNLPSEWVYQVARAVVGAEMQRITYKEFLPVLLGPGAIPPYAGYDSAVDARIKNEFSTASYRFGHSMLSAVLLRLDANGDEIAQGHLPLRDAFFAPSVLVDGGGLEPLFRGLATQTAQAVDHMVVDDVRNFLFGPPGSGGFDLASLNIQRGRDHGLPGYNQLRADYGLAPVSSFAEITSDAALEASLASTYATVDDVDAWIGGLCEDPVPGALVGELVRSVLVDQFTRLRDGDRYWYQRSLPAFLRAYVNAQPLAEIIRRNTTIGSELQADVFRVPTSG